MSKRQFEESKEGLKVVNNNAPESKFQNDQQVQNTMDGQVDPGETKGFVAERKSTPGSVLKTEVAAKTVKDTLYGGVDSGDGLNAGGRSVSGNAGGILGAANMTPIGRESRSETRYGKKLDRNTTKLNFIPNDQVLEEYAESKPLAEAKDLDQGFNGTYRNEFARSQKKVGNVPAELMFSRSLDIIEKDNVYYPQGQYVKQTCGVAVHDEPTMSACLDADGQWVNPVADNYSVERGSYLNRSISILYDKNGVIRGTDIDTRDVTPNVDAAVANKSSSAALRQRNLAELYRETMDTKAGDEKADVWSCLPRAVRQPTQTIAYLRDIEAMTGSEMATAYKKASLSHSFQLNRAHKDGQSLIDPVYDAFDGMYAGYNSAAASEINLAGSAKSGINSIFDISAYAKGSAAILLEAYDTVNKYKTKGDILVQPRSLRMHLQTADNNIDPLKVPKEFIQIFDNQEVFSTIDRDFDPMLPICMTDKCANITSLSYADLYTFFRPVVMKYNLTAVSANAGQSFTLVPKSFCKKAAGQYLHCYAVKAGVQTAPAINTSTGVITLNNDVEKDIYFVINDDSTVMDSSSYIDTVITLSSYADIGITVTSTSKFYDMEVVSLDKIFPTKSGPFNYIYADLRNHYRVKVAFPLLEGLFDYFEDTGRCITKVLMDKVGSGFFKSDFAKTGYTIPILHSTRHFSLWSFLLCAASPYIIKSRINSMRDVLYYEKNVEYPFSELTSIKDMTTRGYTNFNYSDYDHELETKVMDPATSIKWVFPEFWTKIGHDDSNSLTYVLMPWYMNENNFKVESGVAVENDDESNMTMPSIRSGSKLAALDSLYSMTEKDIRLSLDCISSVKPLISDSSKVNADDEQFGAYKYSVMTDGIPYFAAKDTKISVLDVLSLPRELGYSLDAPYGLLTPNVGNAGLSDPASAALVHGTSHRITYWLANDAVKFTPGGGSKILDVTGVNVNRAANFKQTWFTVFANGKQAPFDHGMVMSVNCLYEDDGDAVTGSSLFVPYTNIDDGAQTANANLANVKSLMKALWTRIQKLPFIISPFDALSADSTRTQIEDIFELAYYFGLCGFRASNYRESVYNREKQVVNQGLTFVSDPWINESPLFKEGASSSGIALSVGYTH